MTPRQLDELVDRLVEHLRARPSFASHAIEIDAAARSDGTVVYLDSDSYLVSVTLRLSGDIEFEYVSQLGDADDGRVQLERAKSSSEAESLVDRLEVFVVVGSRHLPGL